MLRIDLRSLTEGPAEVSATLPADDPAFDSLECQLASPVSVAGRIAAAGPGRYYWKGTIRTSVAGTCRRCLTDVVAAVDAELDIMLAEEQDSDDPSVYEIPEFAELVDLTDIVREELVLAVPPFLECRDDCRGLCPQCGKDLNTGECGCEPAPDPRWAGLQALRDALPDNEES